MSTVRVVSTIGKLADDLVVMPRKLAEDLTKTVREGAKVGNAVAKDYARASSGTHGKLYPRSFSVDTPRAKGVFGLGVYSAVYGPDASRPQGNMEFEYGSRNSPAHLDLNRSADLIGPSFAQEVSGVLDRLFW